jgi:hypothetical protein
MRNMLVLLHSLTGSEIDVPAGSAPVLDGVIDAVQEWADAVHLPFGPSGSLWLMHDREYLYLAVRVRGPVVGQVCRERGDLVEVLHASASLGAALYATSNGTLQHTFAWGVRDAAGRPASDDVRAAWAAEHGWLASTAAMGESAREWRFRLGSDSASIRMGIAAFAPGAGGMVGVPGTMRDACLNQAFAMGTTPATVEFRPAEWAKLRLM